MRHLILAAAAVLSLTACGVGAASVPPSTAPSLPPGASPVPPSTAPAVPVTAEAVTDREFWSTAVVGHDLVPDTRVSLTFDPDGRLGGSAGCNLMGGTWSVDGATLVARIDTMTEMGCSEDRFAQDDWLVAWLASGLTATMRGDELVLTGSGVTMTLLDREVADPDRALEGTEWILNGLETGVGDDGTVMSVPAAVEATLRFEGGHLTVDTGCNTGGASATLGGDILTIGLLGMTKRGCEADVALVERHMTAILQGTVKVEIEGRILRLTGPTGGLDFRAR